MRSFTTRIIIVVASVLITIIMAIQVYWLNKTYAFEKNEFNTSVLKVIRGVYEDIPLLYNVTMPLDSLVERRENNFLFRIDSIPQKDTLVKHLATELEDFHVFTDCKMAVFDHEKGNYAYGEYISADASKWNEDTSVQVPNLKRDYDYVHLYFPNRRGHIISEMRFWIYSSLVILLLLIGFSLAIYYFVKQKFLVEIQKDFINNVTHEFSTPLSVINLALEGLEKPSTTNNSEKQKRYVDSIRYQSAYLNNHITNLVNTVVAGQYHLPLKNEEVIPNEILKKVVLQLETMLSGKNGTVDWDLEETNSKIRADGENLYLAFYNIINNAIKYAVQPKVIIRTWLQDGRYFISVKDNGPGIDPSQHKKIFRKFYRAQKGNIHVVKGLGLGLYFTRKVIEAHSGNIRVSSVPGIGSDFTVDLPLNTI